MTEDPSINNANEVEVSVVMPCLNEADTLATCIKKAKDSIERHALNAEIVIADNGSTDSSVEIAKSLGARVVPVAAKGYGNALMGGVEAARGKYVIMGDADDSYDFLDIYKFVEKLREGYDLVQGCRLPAGGGKVLPGAMPWSHRHIGNPMLTALVRWWFKAPVHDVYCGLRGFTKKMYLEINQRCPGMEFATEMIIKCTLYGYRVSEVPITLHPDGRVSHSPHLRTIRDGWRTLRFFMFYSPRWLFFVPGLFLVLIGLLGYVLVLGHVNVGVANLDAHSLLYFSLFVLMGYQSIVFSLLTKKFAIEVDMMPGDHRTDAFFEAFSLERGVLAGIVSMLAGFYFLIYMMIQWWQQGFGDLDYSHTMRIVIPGVMLSALGFQTIMGSFFLGILGMKHR